MRRMTVGSISSFFSPPGSKAVAKVKARIGGVEVEGRHGELDESDVGGGRGYTERVDVKVGTFLYNTSFKN